MDLFLEPAKPLLPFVIPTGSQYSYRWDAVMQAFIIKIPQGELIFAQSFLSEKVSDRTAVLSIFKKMIATIGVRRPGHRSAAKRSRLYALSIFHGGANTSKCMVSILPCRV